MCNISFEIVHTQILHMHHLSRFDTNLEIILHVEATSIRRFKYFSFE